MKIKPINPNLKPLLEEFLSQEELQPLFIEVAKQLGYEGTDHDKIKVALFTPDENNEICFADPKIAELFIDFQIMKQLSMVEPYKTLLVTDPSIKDQLIRISKEILKGKEIDTSAILSLFPHATEAEVEEEMQLDLNSEES